MTYHDIIENNKKISAVPWWVNFAFHYTDVSNAVNILKTGKLFSRIKAEKSKLMVNDNASRQVIDMTVSGAQSFVRFYFRPLTPTQYFNEGYKHPELRYREDDNGNIPVPIFFAFNLEELLNDEKIRFSNFSQAGFGSEMHKGLEGFSKLRFDKIYTDGYVDEEDLKYRHAELLYPNEYEISQTLEAILCRNEVEKETLLGLLYEADKTAYYTYKNKIKICKTKMFERNGLFVDDIRFRESAVNIIFSDTYNKRNYEHKVMTSNWITELKKIPISFTFEWRNRNAVILTKNIEIDVNYQAPKPIAIKIPVVEKAKSVVIIMTIENRIIARVEHILSESEIL